MVDPEFSVDGRPWAARPPAVLLPSFTLDVEREIQYGRLEAAKAFAAANGLNRITAPTPDAWLGIAAAGKTYYDLRQALRDLGLDDPALRAHGIRLLKVGMLFPLEPGIVREFAHGLEEILVVEEKRGFLELLFRDVLYNQAVRPRIVGKRDEAGRILVPADGELDADLVARVVATRLGRLWVSTDADANPRNVHFYRIDTAATPGRFVSGIVIDPADSNHAWISYSGYGAYTPGTPQHVIEARFDPHKHTATFADRSYDIGDQPVTGIERDASTGDLYASTDFGVLRLPAGASAWQQAGSGLPSVAVYGLTLARNGSVLYAATHGRGAYALELP